jgi:hypothetical protein
MTDNSFHPDSEIAEIIMLRRGRPNAVSIEVIGRGLWPDDWDMAGRDGERNRKNISRRVKAAVARLVNRQGLVIVASRGKLHGYFVPVEKNEIDRAVRASVRQAVKMLRRAEKLTGNHRYGEMAGQIPLPF